MELTCTIEGKEFKASLKQSRDISISFGPGGDNPNAFGIPYAEIAPIQVGDFTGSVEQGSGANCDVIRFCAHGNGTHTECIGHITRQHENVADCIHDFVMTADLITVKLETENEISFISSDALNQIPEKISSAIIIRTLPNSDTKRNQNWSGNQPPFFHRNAMKILVEKGYKHLLTDLPSVDPEEDEGKLESHHIWWNYPANPRSECSITELIYVPGDIPDGRYLLNISFPNIRSDASPSRVFITPLTEV